MADIKAIVVYTDTEEFTLEFADEATDAQVADILRMFADAYGDYDDTEETG